MDNVEIEVDVSEHHRKKFKAYNLENNLRVKPGFESVRPYGYVHYTLLVPRDREEEVREHFRNTSYR